MERIFQRNRWRSVMLLVGCLLFLITTLLLLLNHKGGFTLALGIPLFGWGAVVALLQLKPNSGFLRLTQQGFEVKTLYRTDVYRWSDVERFGVTELKLRRGAKALAVHLRVVGFNFSTSYTGRRPIKTTDYDAILPDNYSQDVQQLAATMQEWKQRLAPN